MIGARDAARAARTGSPRRAGLLVGLVLAAATFAVYSIGAARGLDYDASVTVGTFVANDDLWTPFREQVVFNNHPLFSFLEHLVYSAGGRSEAALLVLPLLCGALGVGLVAAWLAIRAGAVVGVAGGLLLAANPAYAELSRSARGYSLMAVCVIGATTTLVALREPRWWLTVLYVACMAVAIGTHVFAGIALSAHAGFVLATRSLSVRWVVAWLASVVLGFAPYLSMLGGMLDNARGRGRPFQPDLPRQIAVMALGQARLAVLALLPLIALACWSLRRSVAAWAVVASVALPFGAVWLGLRPVDVYPRFFLPLAAAVAVGAALAASRAPKALAVISLAVALAAMTVLNGTQWTKGRESFKLAAGIAHAAARHGRTSCSAYFNSEAFIGYGIRPRTTWAPEETAGCDVLFVIEGRTETLRTVLAEQFPHARKVGLVTAYSRDDPTLLDAPPATIPQ